MKLDNEFVEFLLNMRTENEFDQKKVLVVDDDVEILNWFRATQDSEGTNVTYRLLSDELKILEVVDEFRPDLIIMDINLGKISGEKIGQVIRMTSNYKIPIVYMSSRKWAFNEASVKESHFMPKPLNKVTVNKKIHSLLKAG